MKRNYKSAIEFWLFRIGLSILSKFPYYITRNILIRLFFWGGYYLGIRKKIARENLNRIYPRLNPDERESVLRDIYKNFGKTAAETYFADNNKLFSQVRTQGWDNLENALKQGRGVILASAHIGNWELAGRYIASKHNMGVVYKKLRNRYFDAYTLKNRKKYNILQINKKTGLREIIRLLKKNYIITILIDQNARKKGIIVDFLGKPASTFPGAAKIALKTRSPIVPAVSFREGKNLILAFDQIVNPLDYNDLPNPVEKLTSDLNERIAKYILMYPGQWFWVHKRWRISK